jgi:polar amino acid transport system substrate-binding protein
MNVKTNAVAIFFSIFGAMLSQLGNAATPEKSEVLERIRNNKEIVVGVKSDYRPFGFLDGTGANTGLELDLAKDIATRLGVKLRTVAVSSANRLQRLEEGMIDVVIATTGDTADRRRIATMVEPNYYTSGSTLLVPKSKHVHGWNDMRGKQICSVQGNYSNRQMAQRYLFEIVLFNNARDAKLALQDGRCDGYLSDNTAIQGDLTKPEWSAFEAPLSLAMTVPWAIVLARSELGSELEYLLGDTVAEWHRSGYLLQSEKAWGLPPSKFLQDTHLLWKREVEGKPFCVRQPDGHWTAACRNQVLLTAKDVNGLQAIGLWVRELTSLDFTVVYDEYDRTRFIKGILYTILLMVGCIISSCLIALAGLFGSQTRVRAVNKLVLLIGVYGRTTPPLALMYMLFFGAGVIISTQFGVSIHPIVIAILCLSFYAGTTIMAALVNSVTHLIEKDSGFKLSKSNLREVIALSSATTSSQLVNIARATMLASGIAIPELLSITTSIMTDNGNPNVMMNALLVVVFVLVAIIHRTIKHLEQRFVLSQKAAL